MSFTSKKTLIKQGSIFDQENKQKRLNQSMKKVSFDSRFDSAILSDSDEENSLGRQNRRPVKKDNDDLLNLFKNELSDSDEDGLVIGTKTSKDKPMPRPRQNSETQINAEENGHRGKNTLDFSDELAQTINPKRKPRPQPRKGTGDGLTEDYQNASHEIRKPKDQLRDTMSRERPLSATQRNSEGPKVRQEKEIKSGFSLHDSDDDDIVISSGKKTEMVKKGIDTEVKRGKPKKMEEVESWSVPNQRKQKLLTEDEHAITKGLATVNISDTYKNKTMLTKTESKSSEDEEDLSKNKFKNKGRKTSIDEDRKVLDNLQERSNNDFTKSELSKFNNTFSSKKTVKEKALGTPKIVIDDSDDVGKRVLKFEKGSAKLKSAQHEIEDKVDASINSKPLIDDGVSYEINTKRSKEKSLKSSSGLTSEIENEDIFSTSNRSQKSRIVPKSLIGDSDSEEEGTTRKRNEKGSVQPRFSVTENKDLFAKKNRYVKDGAAKRLSESEDENEHKIVGPSPRPRRQKQIPDTQDSKKKLIDGRGADGDSTERNIWSAPKPRVRREHGAENPPNKVAFRSKLHYLDDDNEDDDEDDDDDDDDGTKISQANPQQIAKSNTKASEKRESKVTGWTSLDDSDEDDETVGKRISLNKAKLVSSKKNESQATRTSTPKISERSSPKPNPRHKDKNIITKSKSKTSEKRESKVAGWSSLDDSDEDDETVGKRVSLNKAKLVSSKKNESQATRTSTPKISERSSPRPKPRNKDRFIKTDERERRNFLEIDSKPNKYEANQNSSRETNYDKAGESYRDRTAPNRPSSSQMRQNDRSKFEKDITHTFEEHVPEASDVVGETPEFERTQMNTRDFRRPQSAVTPKRGPMKADRRIEEMTRSPQLRQTTDHFDYEHQDWRYGTQRSLGRQKASSLTNLHETGQATYIGYDSDDEGRRNSLDTQSIRQTVYDNWLSRKNVTIKKELSKKALQKQKEEESAREQREKKRSAELAFKSWNEHKNETLKEKQHKLKADKKQEKEKELEKELKKRDAAKYFESWKSKKDEIIKETYKEKKKEKMEKKKKEDEDKMEKTISSKKSFENWKSKKDDILKQQHKEKKRQEKLEGTKKEEEEYEKTIKNADEFQKWVENKGKPRKKPPPPTLTQRAWVPGSRHTADCIPSKVQPVILPPSSNRARTLSGTFRATKKYYDY